MAIAGTWAGIRSWVGIGMVAAIAGRVPAADDRARVEALSWVGALAAVRDRGADVAARRGAAGVLERLAMEERYGAAARSPEQIRALGDDLSAIAAVIGRGGDDLATRMTLVHALTSESLRPMLAGAAPALLGVVVDESDDPSLRRAILAALLPVGPAEACRSAVLAAARSPAESIRATALSTLERIKIDPDHCLDVAIAALDDPAASVRMAAIDLVGDVASEYHPRAVAVLLSTFRTHDRSFRLLALLRLRELGPVALAVTGELTHALKDPDPLVRIRVATSLVEITGDGEAYISQLIDGLRSKEGRVWRLAASDLMFGWRPGGMVQPPRSVDARVPALLAVLDDPDPDAQGRAAIVLAHVTHRAGPYARSIRRVLESSDPATRSWAALWGNTILRDARRVAPSVIPTPAPRSTSRWPHRRPSPTAVAVGMATCLGLAVLTYAWLDARSRR